MRKSMMLCFALLSVLLAGPISAADVQQKVSRLPALTLPLDPIIKQMFDRRDAMGGAVINLSLVRAHAPKIAKAAALASKGAEPDSPLKQLMGGGKEPGE